MGYSGHPGWQEFLHLGSDSGSFRACLASLHASPRMLASSDGRPRLRNGAYGCCSPAIVRVSRVSLWWGPTYSISPAGRRGSRSNLTEANMPRRLKPILRVRPLLRAWGGRSFASGTAKFRTTLTVLPRRFSSKLPPDCQSPTPNPSLFPGRGEVGARGLGRPETHLLAAVS